MSNTPRVLVVGTRNRKKCREMEDALRGLPLAVRPLSDFEPVEAAEETGDTFEANAEAKALQYTRQTGHWCVADDSGLEVPALGHRPGIYSARWGGEDGNDDLNNRKLMNELKGVPRDRWQARFVCAVALASPDEGVLLSARGTVEGVITDRPAGDSGFGYDPHFYLPDRHATAAELTPDEKLAVSHRGNALRDLRRQLEALLASRNA
jgi:XTP/dITP diphosphohydrolase